MRKIIVLSMISLDAVMQAPGGQEEDTSGGFKFGGWTAPFADDESREVIQEELNKVCDYILGRKTFEIWAAYWPLHIQAWPGINKGKKYVFSSHLDPADPLITGWNNTELINTVDDLKKLKEFTGRDIQVWGSSKLVQLLFQHDMVDELRLKLYPVILGNGKKLFDGHAMPAGFSLMNTRVSSKGIVMANYKRAGKVETGEMGVK